MRRPGVNAAPRRLLLLLALGLVLPFALLQPKESSAQTTYTHPIAVTALKYLNTHGGQCWTFMKKVVAEATGRQIGFDYRLGFFEAGAYEVSPEEAREGDIIQIASDANTSPWANYPGLHTAIILENLGGGRFNAIDSNQNWDEWVRLRPNYDPYAAAARYGLQVHIYRIPLDGWSAPAPSVPAAETPPSTSEGEWAPGTQAVVSAGTGDCLNLRTAAGLGAARIDCLPTGTNVTVKSSAVSADGFAWVQVESPSGTGWVAANYLTKTGSAPVSTQASGELRARTDDSPGCLRVRAGAGLSAAIRDCLAAGTELVITDNTPVPADGYNWVQIRIDGRVSGWVASEYLVR